MDMKQMIRKKNVIIALAAILAVSVISIPGTLAYFSDYDKAAGAAPLKLAWQTELQEQVKDNNKHITIKNVGDVDVIVRVQVFGGDFVTVTDTAGCWTKSGEWWYYNYILKPGEETTELFVKVNAANANTPEPDFNVIVVHESQRTVYEDNTTLLPPDGWDAAVVRAIKVRTETASDAEVTAEPDAEPEPVVTDNAAKEAEPTAEPVTE